MNQELEMIIKDGCQNMDFNKITEMLSKSYWSPGITKDEVMKGAENSALVIGVFIMSGEQIGYARVISDKTRFAYLCDVFVEENYRKRGIGQKLINFILNHKELLKVYQWLLITKDAHGLYSKIGFKPVSRPNDWMEIRNERPKR